MREAERAWKKANTVMISFRLQRNTDADLLEYLDQCESKAAVIKEALRAWISSTGNKMEGT